MTERFTDEDTEFEPDEDERPTRGRRGQSAVPDGPVENYADVPLLTFAGKGKANTITFLKVIRLDGPSGVRGYKGQMAASSTVEDVARKHGNGTYKIEGCNASNRVLAVENQIEIAIPGFEASTNQPLQRPAMVAPSDGLHGMKMIADMARGHEDSIRDQTSSANENVKDMATSTMQMLTSFTAAQRESERAAHEAATRNQQQFFATMMAMQNQSHAQQMEMLTAMHDRSRASEADPMAMIRVFMDGLKTAGELGGGEGQEPWVAALAQGSTMMGHLAHLANAPATTAAIGRNPSLPSPGPAMQPNPLLPPGADPTVPAPAKKRRIPIDKAELRAMVKLKATLRQRGIALSDMLEQTAEYYQNAPESELYEDSDDNDGPVASDDHADTIHTPTNEAPTSDAPG